MATLNGRIGRLELKLAELGPDRCRTCGLRHVQPLTIDLVRRLLGPVSAMATALRQYGADNPAPRLCLCDPCCGDPGDRWVARRSHGMSTDEGTA